MKKRLICFFVTMVCVMTAVFAADHTRSQVTSFLREYESIATDMERYANDFDKAVTNYLKSGADFPSSLLNKQQSIQSKLNDIVAKVPFYYDDLTEDDFNKLTKAAERVSVANAKILSASQRLANSSY